MYLVFTSVFILTLDYVDVILGWLGILVLYVIFSFYNCLTKI